VRLRDAPLTHAPEGAARSGEMPDGFRGAHRRVVVGSGRADFERATAAVFDWRAQRGAGLRVRAHGPGSEPGTATDLYVRAIRRAARG
jgi:uncharacterized protein (UPF0548 family)